MPDRKPEQRNWKARRVDARQLVKECQDRFDPFRRAFVHFSERGARRRVKHEHDPEREQRLVDFDPEHEKGGSDEDAQIAASGQTLRGQTWCCHGHFPEISPYSAARRAAARRLGIPSLVSILWNRELTDCGDVLSCRAISFELSPCHS